MYVTILGKKWNLKFESGLRHPGECDAPSLPGKAIKISKKLTGEKKLETILHELWHAAHWHMDEEYVDQASRDVARALWRLGYRERE